MVGLTPNYNRSNVYIFKRVLDSILWPASMIISAIYGSGVGPVSDTYNLLITPANYAFSIWWLIYFFGGLYWLYGLLAPNDSYLLSSTGNKIKLCNTYNFGDLIKQITNNPTFDHSCSYTYVAGSLWHASIIGIKFSLLQILNMSWILVFNVGNDVSIVIACLLSIAMLIVLTFIEVHNNSFSEISSQLLDGKKSSHSTSVLFGPFYTPCDHICNAGIKITRRVSTWQKALVVDFTFAIEQAWLIIATSLGISMVVKLLWSPSDDVAQWFAMAVLIILYCVTGVYGYVRSNPYTTLVGSWSYMAIYVNSSNDVVSYTAIVLSILLFVEFFGYIFYYITRMSGRMFDIKVGVIDKRD